MPGSSAMPAAIADSGPALASASDLRFAEARNRAYARILRELLDDGNDDDEQQPQQQAARSRSKSGSGGAGGSGGGGGGFDGVHAQCLMALRKRLRVLEGRYLAPIMLQEGEAAAETEAAAVAAAAALRVELRGDGQRRVSAPQADANGHSAPSSGALLCVLPTTLSIVDMRYWCSH